jgi:hypothetical protein
VDNPKLDSKTSHAMYMLFSGHYLKLLCWYLIIASVQATDNSSCDAKIKLSFML